MKIIPVLDLQNGQAVHAIGGDRAHYRPVRSVLDPDSPNDGDPLRLARAYRDRLGLTELYLADLDAIAQRRPPNQALYRRLLDDGFVLRIDAGWRDGRDAETLTTAPGLGDRALWMAGLETMRGPQALREIVSACGPDRLIFSLDLRDGQPLLAAEDWSTRDPLAIAAIAIEAGIRRILPLDLARVGRGRGAAGSDWIEPLKRIRSDIQVVIGGGIAEPAELKRLAGLGVWAVLVASALHQGRIGRDDLQAVAQV